MTESKVTPVGVMVVNYERAGATTTGKVTSLEYHDGAGNKMVALRAGGSESTSTPGWLWFLAPLLLGATLLAGLTIRRRSSRRPL